MCRRISQKLSGYGAGREKNVVAAIWDCLGQGWMVLDKGWGAFPLGHLLRAGLTSTVGWLVNSFWLAFAGLLSYCLAIPNLRGNNDWIGHYT